MRIEKERGVTVLIKGNREKGIYFITGTGMVMVQSQRNVMDVLEGLKEAGAIFSEVFSDPIDTDFNILPAMIVADLENPKVMYHKRIPGYLRLERYQEMRTRYIAR